MLVALKTRLRAVLPSRLFFPMRSLWHRMARTPHVALAATFAARFGTVVTDGPFAGLRYVDFGSGSALVPKLIGSYELELHDALRALPARRLRRVVNIGCGEGYYAVGLARMLEGVEVIASDTAPSARALCERLAAANGVADRVHVVGGSTPAGLDAQCGPGTLVIMDCEGCEAVLADPARIPSLRATDLIVELHPHAWFDAATEMRRRFESTHDVELVDSLPRSPADFPALDALEPRQRQAALLEREGPQQWAVCWSRDR